MIEQTESTREQKILAAIVELLREIESAIEERQARMAAPFFKTSAANSAVVGEERALREVGFKLNGILYGWANEQEVKWKRVLLDMVDGDPRRFADYVEIYERQWNQERQEHDIP